jgi:hypothetical protein
VTRALAVAALSVVAAAGVPGTATPTRPCSTVSAAAAVRLRVLHVARADVDGDGRADAVWIGTGRTRRVACRFFLAVRTSRGTFTVRFGLPGYDRASDAPPPAVAALARVDAHPGREVVVEVARGASTSFYAILGFERRRLVRFLHAGRVPGPQWQDVFEAGGPVTIATGLECERSRTGILVQKVLLSGRLPRSRAIEDRYRFAAGRFRLVGHSVRHLSPGRASRYRLEFFAGCAPLFTRDRF